MKDTLLNFWRSLKPGVRSSILTGVAATYLVLLPGVTIAQLKSAQNLKTLQRQNDELKTNLNSFSSTLDTLVKDGSSSTVTQELRSLRDEVIKYRAEQQGRDQILGLTQYGSVAVDPLDSITKSIASLEEMTASGSAGSGTTNALSATPAPVQADGSMLGTLTMLKDKGWSSVDAFESPVASSKIVGQIVVNVSYPFYAKQTGWYQATLASGKKGWVQAQFVKEE